jgi:hypothetical protein
VSRAELRQIKQQRRMAAASLDFSKAFEEIRQRHKLGDWEAVELLQEQAQLYLKVFVRRMRGKR